MVEINGRWQEAVDKIDRVIDRVDKQKDNREQKIPLILLLKNAIIPRQTETKTRPNNKITQKTKRQGYLSWVNVIEIEVEVEIEIEIKYKKSS